MRAPLRLAATFPLLAQVAAAQAPSPLPDDPALQSLVRDALDRSPELAGTRERLAAEQERVPQAGSLPDPVLFLGYQNDGFDKLQYGRMETTWGTVMATQAFPYPGKRRLRSEVAQQGVEAAQAGLERVRLTLEADVRRAFTALLLVRGKLALLQEQGTLWENAEAIAKVRYETGQGSQTDLLRAQLERTRLKQARAALGAEERSRLAELNRLAVRDLDAPIDIATRLDQLPDPPSGDALADAERRSPELSEAGHHLRHFQSQVDLARLETRPDFALSAGVMPRGALPAMWQVGFSVSLPIYGRSKQHRAIAESEALARSGQQSMDGLRRLLAQRVQERADQLAAALEVFHIYRDGLLTQSEATVQSTLAQYQVGRGAFTSVLEALTGYVADRSRYLDALAQAQAIAIATREVSLAPTPAVGASAMGPSPMASSQASGMAPSRPASAPSPASAPAMSPM